MAQFITIEVEGDKPVIRRLERTSRNVSDLRPAFRSVADYLRSVFGRQFASQGSSGNASWAPLKEATLRRKQASGMDPRILQMTESMRRSFESQAASDHVMRMTSSSLFVGSRDPKAKHHQHGAPRANVPQRKIVSITERNRRQVVKRIQAHVFDRPVSGTGDV